MLPKYTLLFPLIAALLIADQSRAQAPVPADFAYGCSLPVSDATGLYRLQLPASVYAKLQQQDLRDLQVFNAAGEPMAQMLHQPQPPAAPIRRAIPFFPLPEKAQAPTSDLRVQVERHSDGSIITINSDATTAPSPSGCSYLLDVSGPSPKPQQLELQWSAGAATSMYRVQMWESSDLADWQPLGAEAVVADLEYNGGRISQRSLHLPRTSKPYLRMDCVADSPPLRLTGIEGIIGGEAAITPWQWQQPQPGKTENQQGVWSIEYQIQGRLRVEALDLHLPEANSSVRAVVESRPTSESPWQRVASGEFYRLDVQGSGLRNPLLRCATTTDPWWRLTITAGTATTTAADKLPQLRLGWQADDLLFLGRGQGPYTLAFGSGRSLEAAGGQEALIRTALLQPGSEARIQQIVPGPIHALGGEQALQPPPATIPWQRILLWLVLVAGVALLALMARSMYQEMNNKPR